MRYSRYIIAWKLCSTMRAEDVTDHAGPGACRIRLRPGPCASQTQGKIERWHQTLKNRIRQENYFLPGDLEGQIEAFVEHYDRRKSR